VSAAVAVGILVGAGVYLVLQRGIARMALGFVVLGHAANLLLVSSGGTRRRDIPVVGSGIAPADPLPQAFVLTAIVIGFGVMCFLLALAHRAGTIAHEDHLEDDS
jgi:multicomponent Na+:H+ antiporter subunit C